MERAEKKSACRDRHRLAPNSNWLDFSSAAGFNCGPEFQSRPLSGGHARFHSQPDYRPLQIVVMDGGSRDETVSVLQSYGDIPELSGSRSPIEVSWKPSIKLRPRSGRDCGDPELR